MTVTVSPEKTIRNLPEWHDAAWSELPGGLTNRAWLLDKDGRKAVLKIDAEPRAAPFNTRAEEAAVQSAAAAAGLASPVLLANQQVYLTEYVNGSQWLPSCLNQQGTFEQLAASLRRLHALPRTGRSFDAVSAASQYVAAVENPDGDIVSLCLSIVRNARLPNYLCCCHNDLVAENILTTPKLRFLDWEYACDNDPMFDLATIVEHHELNEGQAVVLLDAYFEGSGEQWREALQDQRRLYLALYYLWMASRSESSEKVLQKLGCRLTTNCS